MANKIHAVVRTDLMTGTDVASDLRSVRYFDAAGEMADIDNGCVLKLEGLLDGEREIFKGVAPAADTKLSEVVLLATPELMYDEREKHLVDFYNAAGRACRGYVMHTNDIFSVTAPALDGVLAKGNYVELQASHKMNAVAAATGATVVGKIIDVETVGSLVYYVILVA